MFVNVMLLFVYLKYYILGLIYFISVLHFFQLVILVLQIKLDDN